MKNSQTELICKICNNSENNKTIIVQERMLNLLDSFEYFECSKCGCLQISKIPENMDKYYPKNYYSFAPQPSKSFLNLSIEKIKDFLLKNLVNYSLGNKYNFVGWIVAKNVQRYAWLNKDICHINSKILDVGCGSGSLLTDMKKHGFTNLKGIDPFILSNIKYDSGVVIEKKYIHEVTDTFDFIMLHHSFEHMDNPEMVMKEIYRLLNPNSYALIRIPIAGSYAYKKYNINWIQLDAPRHFFLHSPTDIQYLVKKAGLELKSIVYDSTHFQFTGSECYQKGYNPFSGKGIAALFSKKEIKAFTKKANEVNALHQGDQACFFIYKNA